MLEMFGYWSLWDLIVSSARFPASPKRTMSITESPFTQHAPRPDSTHTHLTSSSTPKQSLLIILLALLTHNIEELQAVLALARADHAQPVAQLLLLEKLLRQVLEVAAGELLVRDDLDAAVAQVADADGVAQIAGAALDFDALLQEGGEGGGVEDAVVGGLRCVDDELFSVSAVVSFTDADARGECVLESHLPRNLALLLRASALQAAAAGRRSLLHCANQILVHGDLEPTAHGQHSEIRTGPATILSVSVR